MMFQIKAWSKKTLELVMYRPIQRCKFAQWFRIAEGLYLIRVCFYWIKSCLDGCQISGWFVLAPVEFATEEVQNWYLLGPTWYQNASEGCSFHDQ